MDPDLVAREIHDAIRGRRMLEPLPAVLGPSDLDEAYAVQDALCALLEADRGALAGYKIAMTTPQAQALMGIDQPSSGVLFADRVLEGQMRVRHSDFVRATIECEIAMRLGSDLPIQTDPFTRRDVETAVESCMAAVELVDDTGSDYRSTSATDLIGWNVWNWGLALGPPRRDWQTLDLAEMRVTMTVGAGAPESGSGSNVLGHPLNAMLWLANHLRERGRSLRRGMVVTTGCIVGPRWPDSGDRVEVEMEGLEPLVVDFE